MNCFFNLRSAALSPENPAAPSRPTRYIGRALRPSLLALPLALLAAGPALAQEPAVQMTQPDNVSLYLRFDNPTRHPAYLTVMNLNKNESILTQTHREPTYGTRLLFDKLPAGAYAVMLRVGRDRYRYAVQIALDATGKLTVAVRETITHRVESGLATARL